MCISTGNFDSIFFLGFTPFLNLEIWRKWKILLKQFVSTTPLKPLNRIAWNFVVMKDIMCRYAFLQEILIWSFWGVIYIPRFVRLPVPKAWNCHSLYTAFSSNVGAWDMWACSLFLSLYIVFMFSLHFMILFVLCCIIGYMLCFCVNGAFRKTILKFVLESSNCMSCRAETIHPLHDTIRIPILESQFNFSDTIHF